MPDNFVTNKQHGNAIQYALKTLGSPNQPNNFVHPFDLNKPQADDAFLRAIRNAMYGLGYIPAVSSETHDPGNANGKMLIEAVREFQRQHAVTSDAIIGNNTLTELRQSLLTHSHDVSPAEDLSPPPPWRRYKVADISKDKARV